MISFRQLSLLLLLGAVFQTGCGTTPVGEDRNPANLGGVNYFRGSYSCANEDDGLQSDFAFGKSTATFNLKGEEVSLDCSSGSSVDPEVRAIFQRESRSFGQYCARSSKKGNVYTAASNSMGIVQVTAYLFKGNKKTAQSVLNCEAASRGRDSGW